MTLRLGLILGALGAFIIFVWFALHWREEAIRERARADSEASRAAVAGATSQIVERTFTKETVTQEAAHEAVEAIQVQPGASDPVPDAVLDRWRAGIDRMRDGSGGGDDQRADDASSAVPAT